MPCSITYNPETECILVSVEGEFDLALFDSMAAEVARCIDENDCRLILNDLRHASLTEHVAGIYSMPEHALKEGIGRGVKRALVVSGTLSEFWFLETVFLNQGNIVKLFNKIDDAKRWLFEKK
ncbi:MAG: hypothetical protein KAV42_00140 [Candidatus Krumholzibacteria bacterium]|nr:hypothetical protein [Candidatus Krumholzibacteria bacterium]